MAKEKVHTCGTGMYTSSSDKDFDDDLDYSDLFKGLDRSKVNKINELVDALNEKDRLQEKQEVLLYEEHDNVIEVEKSLALEIKKNEILAFDLSSCHASISSLKIINVDLNARIEKLNVSSSSFEHVSICTRCKDHDIDACVIEKLNDEIAQLIVQLKTCKNEIDKNVFDRDAYTVGRNPSIKDGLGFHGEAKDTKSHKSPNLTKEKALMASSSHSFHDKKNHAFIYTHCWSLVLKCCELRTRQHNC
jgi:hypothetical protein